jgi:hypothetical protein
MYNMYFEFNINNYNLVYLVNKNWSATVLSSFSFFIYYFWGLLCPSFFFFFCHSWLLIKPIKIIGRAYVLALIKTPILVIQQIWRNFPKSFLDITSHPPLSPCHILCPLVPLHRLAPGVNSKTQGIFYMEI